ncbi:MAG: InlB B-repeat-containing protein [Candidatus Izemoplasmatales bacterium]
MKKGIITFVGLLMISLSLASCGGGESNSETPSSFQENGYQIVWKNYDGTVLETDENVREGTLPTYNGATPTKSGDAQYSYSFASWTPTVSQATSNQVYTATFTTSINQYIISFDVNNGSPVAPITANYGTQINEPTAPTRQGYRFVAWTSDITLNNEVIWPITLTENRMVYAKWNEQVPYGTYLEALLENYSMNPLSYVPDSMLPGANLVTDQQASLNFENNTNVSAISYVGHGDQWNMVLTNIEQSMVFFNLLSVVDSISGASIVAFNNYLDSNPAEANSYEFLSGIYQVSILFENNVLSYVLDYTANLPVFGEQTIQIALTFNIQTFAKTGRVQIGNAHALRYEMTENSYKFAIKYLGVRRAYFEINRSQNGNVSGKIFEYLDVELAIISSAAQFYISDDYVSVVGNKADGMMAWTGYINEVYLVDSGIMCGYEVRETLSSVTYNTLWFNLDDIMGISSVKKAAAPIENANPDLVYVNGSANVFATKTVGGLNLKSLSRRFDIEFRTQFFYYMNGEELMKVALSVPMLFVQQENYSTLKADIESTNSGVVSNFAVTLSATHINKITSDYSTLIDAFILQKDSFSIEMIISFIGSES